MFLSQVFNGLLLPVILTFVMLIGSDRRRFGRMASGRVISTLGWTITALVSLMSVAFVISLLLAR
jgi:Mn2+/Fe2+ NRAMP family transporter